MIQPHCPECQGRGEVTRYWLYPRPGRPDPDTEPCPLCFPAPLPELEPEYDHPGGRLLATFYPASGKWSPPPHNQ